MSLTTYNLPSLVDKNCLARGLSKHYKTSAKNDVISPSTILTTLLIIFMIDLCQL